MVASPPSGRRRSSCLTSCFGSSLVSDADDDDLQISGDDNKPIPKALGVFSRFRKKQNTAPLDSKMLSSVITPVEITANAPVKLKKDINHKTNIKRHHHQPSSTKKHESSASQLTRSIQHNSSRSSIGARQSPLQEICESAEIGTTASHPFSPKPTNICLSLWTSNLSLHRFRNVSEDATGKLSPDVGFLVLAVTLATLLLFGRAAAIVCMAAWLYLLPRFRPRSMAIPVDRSPAQEIEEVNDMCSEDYKKRVVLQGLLERNKPKHSFTSAA